jgi:hypothetical protein
LVEAAACIIVKHEECKLRNVRDPIPKTSERYLPLTLFTCKVTLPKLHMTAQCLMLYPLASPTEQTSFGHTIHPTSHLAVQPYHSWYMTSKLDQTDPAFYQHCLIWPLPNTYSRASSKTICPLPDKSNWTPTLTLLATLLSWNLLHTINQMLLMIEMLLWQCTHPLPLQPTHSDFTNSFIFI